jgi:hypothetical protein
VREYEPLQTISDLHSLYNKSKPFLFSLLHFCLSAEFDTRTPYS